MMQGGGEVAELIHAPAVAEVRRQLARPAWLAGHPLAVDALLWSEARAQLGNVLQARGWPLAADEELLRKGVENFLLCGVPVVMADG